MELGISHSDIYTINSDGFGFSPTIKDKPAINQSRSLTTLFVNGVIKQKTPNEHSNPLQLSSSSNSLSYKTTYKQRNPTHIRPWSHVTPTSQSHVKVTIATLDVQIATCLNSSLVLLAKPATISQSAS